MAIYELQKIPVKAMNPPLVRWRIVQVLVQIDGISQLTRKLVNIE